MPALFRILIDCLPVAFWPPGRCNDIPHLGAPHQQSRCYGEVSIARVDRIHGRILTGGWKPKCVRWANCWSPARMSG